MNKEQRVVIEEVVGRRGHFPPGGMQWLALRRVLEELLAEDAVKTNTVARIRELFGLG